MQHWWQLWALWCPLLAPKAPSLVCSFGARQRSQWAGAKGHYWHQRRQRQCAKGNLFKVHQWPYITYLGDKVQNAGFNAFLPERSGYNKLISWKGFHHFGLGPLIVFIFASILVKVYVNVNQFKSADMTYKTHFNL